MQGNRYKNMNLLPLVIPLEEDELLGSWMYRLSRANLFDNTDIFIKNFVRANAHNGYHYIKYDDTEEFTTFYHTLQSSTSMADLFLKTTCYSGLAPFLTSGQQTRRVNLSFRKTYGHSEFTPKVTPLTRELRYCKQCRLEELESNGFWYYHRAHQLPGVRVCHKHSCLLKIYKGRIGHEFDDDAPFETTTPNTQLDIMVRYSLFAKGILDTAPYVDMNDTKLVLKDALVQHGYYVRSTEYEKLKSDIQESGMSQMFPEDIEHYISISLASLYYPSVEQTMAMAFFLFGTAEAFIQKLLESKYNKFGNRLDGKEYQIVGPFRKNLVHLRHTCGTEFCVTADGFTSGWSCPKCDAALSNQAIMHRLITYAGNHNYQLRSDFKGFNTNVRVLHQACGRTLELTPRAFLHEGKRCTCESQQKKEALLKRLRENSNFEMVEYVGHSTRLTLRHLNCNRLFECNYDHFIADMRCPHCESGVSVGIKKPMDITFLKERIKALVGDEYTLESNSLQCNVPVVIRHNKCGRTQSYAQGKFLAGRRCSYCHTVFTIDEKYELIPYLSNGEYKPLSIDNERYCRFKNCISEQEYEMDFDHAVQELIRPTPSPILPCQNPNREIDKFIPTTFGYYEKIFRNLKTIYGENDVLFKEDFETFGADELQMKRTTKKLVKKNIVERIYPGIYKWTGSDVTEYDVIYQRYIRRKGHQIGYLYGNSFAYEIGLITCKPDRIYITTNQEANLHGREYPFLGYKIYLRGAKAQVTDENWKILQLLDLLPNLSKYTIRDNTHTAGILRSHIHKNDLTYKQAEPYLSLYPSWVGLELKKLCEEIYETNQ